MLKPITLRSATMEDAELVYQWRNSDYVRSTRINQDIDDYNDHIEWWQSALISAYRDMFMIEYDGLTVGHVRFDHRKFTTEISIVLDPKYCGKGLGTEAIKLSCAFMFECNQQLHSIQALILESNKSSIRSFTKSGFIEDIRQRYIGKNEDETTYTYVLFRESVS